MRRSEKVILGIIAVIVLPLMARNFWQVESGKIQADKGIPYYSTASVELTKEGARLYDQNGCKECHSLWTVRDIMQNVPAPILDGIGSLRSEQWFYQYFSAPNPQAILPSRLKKQYRMPSFQTLSDHDRHVLAEYMSSLKVKGWYLEATRKAEYEKLTGKTYHN